MTARRYVPDASALVALLEGEDGADRVESVMQADGAALLPLVALMEVYYVSMRTRGEVEAARRHALLTHSRAPVLREMDDATLVVAARLKAGHRLSLADAIAAAHAVLNSAVLLQKDPEFEPLANDVVVEALPYEPRSPQP